MDDAVLIEKGEELSSWLADPDNEGQVAQTRLAASDRVIARVTDGIYRQPASALRELISNAWDADASSVTILTDAPRFSRIYVRDDGAGMSHDTLTRLLKNIGGSAKRREEGKELGVVSLEDVERTPGGRPLIGKIGIGLFSISQLSRRFQIITKVKGENYRLFAEIRLRTYTETDSEVEADEGDDYISGDVMIRREHTSDLDAHGTDIILDDVKPRVRDLLRSADRWESLAERDAAFERGDLDTYASMRVEKPAFHSGYIGNLNDSLDAPVMLAVAPELPWTSEDPADVRMAKLMDAVEGEFINRFDRPELATTLDSYLEMIWTLGLTAPVGYVDRHPFDLMQDGHLQLYWVTKERGRGQELRLESGVTVREAVKAQVDGAPELTDGLDPVGGFRVVMDEVELKRPIRYKHYPTGERGLNSAVMFVGRFEPDLRRVAASQRGGDLSLEAYLFWTGRVVPKENNGVLVRIRGASGASFDPTFFKYQISEQTRLRQIMSELFVQRGLDAALNIDRESFNYSHPHLQLVTLWLHGAIRQLTNRLKDEAEKLRLARKAIEAQAGRDFLSTKVEQVWRNRRGDELVPDVVIADSVAAAQEARQKGAISVLRLAVPTAAKPDEQTARDSQAAALVQVLAAYDVLEGRTYDEQQELVAAILAIFQGGSS